MDVLDQLTSVERPARAETAWSRGQALYNLSRYAEAENAVDRCLELSPRSAGCWLLRANVLAKLDRLAEANAAFEQAQSLRGR